MPRQDSPHHDFYSLHRAAARLLALEQQINLAHVAVTECRRITTIEAPCQATVIEGETTIVELVCDAVQEYLNLKGLAIPVTPNRTHTLT